jgi:Uncharacterized protein conserved in bacteria (DUF2188)
MPDITIHRHGERWALHEAGAESPTKEFGTREAAEQAAHELAGGGKVEVHDEDPTTLGDSRQPIEDQPGDDEVNAVSARERARSVQTGL